MNAVLTLVAALQHGDAFVRRAVANALGEIRREPAHSVPALVNALKDADAGVREHAAIALAKIGLPAVPSLIELLEEIDVPANRNRSPAALQGTDARLADYAAVSLIEIGPSAVPALMEAVRAGKSHTRGYARFLINKAGKGAYPTLLEALEDENVDVHSFAVAALTQIPGDVRAIPILNRLLRSNDEALRRNAAYALTAIGPDAVPTLIAAVSDQDEDVRRAAIEALASMAAQAVESIPTLIGALQDESMVRSAATTLGQLGKPAQPAIPELQRAVKGAEERRQEVLSALGDLRAGDEGSVAVLTEALADPDPNVQRAAASSLAKIGLAAAPAVPALVRALGQESIAESEEIKALASIGPRQFPISSKRSPIPAKQSVPAPRVPSLPWERWTCV